MRRFVLVVSLAVVATGCGLDDARAGVRVVGDQTISGDDFAESSGGEAAGLAPTRSADADGPGADVDDDRATDGVPSASPSSVAVVGDSLTRSAQREIERALTDLGLDVLAVDGVESRRMVDGGRSLPPGVTAIDDILDGGESPELWIVALGTNDVGAQVSLDDFRDDVATVLSTIPAGAPVIWIDLWIRDRRDDVVAANRALRSVAAIRPSTKVVDWYANGEAPGVITRDGIHLTDLGREVFAATMADAVGEMFGA